MESNKSTPAANTHPEKNKPGMSQGLHQLFIDGLKDIYWAEKALVGALPKMVSNATNKELAEALTAHLQETKEHVTRLETVFTSIGEKPEAVICDAMVGLLKEAGHIMEQAEKGDVRDAGIIAASQKVEHYEIATYGTLCAFARTMDHEEAVTLLQLTLGEEKAANDKLTEIAVNSVNKSAVH